MKKILLALFVSLSLIGCGEATKKETEADQLNGRCVTIDNKQYRIRLCHAGLNDSAYYIEEIKQNKKEDK